MGLHDRTPKNSSELAARNISTECPHCGDTVALQPASEPVNYMDNSYFVGLCPNHHRKHCRPLFAVYQPLNDRLQERYPIPSFEASSMHKAIPESIREDYAEARRCMYVSSHKAAVAMFRRVVEALACDKLGEKAKGSDGKSQSPYKLIELLHQNGVITRDVKDSAHELRLLGNYGAHVQDDGLNKVTPEEAKDVNEIAWQLLYSIYVGPYKTAELRKARESKVQP